MNKIIIASIVFIFCSATMSNGQAINTVTPGQGAKGQPLNLTISGNNTHFLQGSQSIWFTQGSYTVSPDMYTATSNTSVSAAITFPYVAPTGFYDVNIYNNYDGFMNKPAAFQLQPAVTQPSLVKMVPNYGFPGQTIPVTIIGNGTQFTNASVTAWLSQGSPTYYISYLNTLNDTTLQGILHLNNYFPGYHDLITTDQIHGNLYAQNKFLVVSLNTPYITASPDTLIEGQTTNVSIIGNSTHFLFDIAHLQVCLNQGSINILPDNINVSSDQLISATFTVPAGNIGPFTLFVQNSIDGTMSYNGMYVKTIGIEEQLGIERFRIYPLPADNLLTIDLQLDFPAACSAKLFDINGSMILATDITYLKNYKIELPVSELNPGIYFLKVKIGKKNIVRKITVL